MKVRVDRDSVAAGDDMDPHDRVLELPETLDLEGVVANVLRVYQLPLIGGGRATWAAMSRRPIAVVAQQWTAPRMLRLSPRTLSECSIVDGVLRLHFTYFAQHDPEVVVQILERLHLGD